MDGSGPRRCFETLSSLRELGQRQTGSSAIASAKAIVFGRIEFFRGCGKNLLGTL
jgi:hypothetical protein